MFERYNYRAFGIDVYYDATKIIEEIIDITNSELHEQNIKLIDVLEYISETDIYFKTEDDYNSYNDISIYDRPYYKNIDKNNLNIKTITNLLNNILNDGMYDGIAIILNCGACITDDVFDPI
jgi:hypothetical protein